MKIKLTKPKLKIPKIIKKEILCVTQEYKDF